MGLIDRLAGEPNYDGMPEPEPPGVSWDRPLLEYAPKDPSHYTYTSPPPVLHQWVSAEPKLKVKLERGMKGTYAWEISYEARDADALVPTLTDMDDRLRALYGGLP